MDKLGCSAAGPVKMLITALVLQEETLTGKRNVWVFMLVFVVVMGGMM